jgi:hypothetical protein
MGPSAGFAAGIQAQDVLSVKPLALIILFVALCIGSGWALPAPMLERKCDAQIVAEQMNGLTELQFVEVVDALEATGAIDKTYAAELREFIKQAYSAPDIGAWVRSQCAPQSKTEKQGDSLAYYVKR